MLRILLVLGLAAFCAAKTRVSHCCSAEDRHIVQRQWQTLFDYMEHSSKLKIHFAELLLLRYTQSVSSILLLFIILNLLLLFYYYLGQLSFPSFRGR